MNISSNFKHLSITDAYTRGIKYQSLVRRLLRLSALLEKQLRREKKTRRQLQRRLGVSNHGDGDDASRGRAQVAGSLPVDDAQLGTSNVSDVPASAYQTPGLSHQSLSLSQNSYPAGDIKIIKQN